MKIVVDTNVLVSGLLNPRGSPGRIVDLVVAGWRGMAGDGRTMTEAGHSRHRRRGHGQ